MRRLITPDEREDYKPTGLYLLPPNERKTEFLRLLRENKEDVDLTQERLDALKEMRGLYL